jgi:O-antigen/teichoic acid export membrane protein
VTNLGLFGIGLPLLYIDMVLGTAIIASNKSKQLAWIALAGVVVNVGLNAVMIPYTQAQTGNGGIGAALATIITEFVVLLAHLRILDRSILDPKGTSVLPKTAAAGAVLVAFFAATAGTNLGGYWMVHASIGALVYAGSLLAVKTFSAAELDFIRGFFSVKTLREVVASRGGNKS